jgi:hypothetical protein
MKAGFATRWKIVNLAVSSVTVYPSKAVIEGFIPIIQGEVLISATFSSRESMRQIPYRMDLLIDSAKRFGAAASVVGRHTIRLEQNFGNCTPRTLAVDSQADPIMLGTLMNSGIGHSTET